MQTSQKFNLNLLLILLGLFFSLLAIANEKNNNKIIHVAISDFPPVEMLVKGKATGINIDIMNALFKKLKITPKYEQMPFKRCLISLEKGTSDIIGSLQYSVKRDKYLSYIKPAYSKYHIIFYMRKGEENKLAKYNDLHQLKVGVLRGYKNFEQFDNDKKIVKEPVNSWKSNYLKLIAKRVDVVVDDNIEGPYRAHLFGLHDKVAVAPYNYNAGYNGFFALSRKSKFYSQQKEFEKILKEMIKTGEIEQIIKSSLAKQLKNLIKK